MKDYEIRCQRCEKYRDNQSEENYDTLICDKCVDQKENTWQIQSMDRQSMIQHIKNIVWTSDIWCEAYTDERNEVLMIWDVLDRANETMREWKKWDTFMMWPITIQILNERQNKRKPIGDQSDVCIQYVYELTLQSE
jgi:hypothetical protein